MVPVLSQFSTPQEHYLSFLEALKAEGFRGDISHAYGDRTVASTDNSVYQWLPQAVVYPRDENDLVVLCSLVDRAPFDDIVLSPRGGGTGTNGQSLTHGVVVDVSRHMNQVLEISAEEGWVRVQTGVVKDQLNAALKPHGLFFAPELSTSNRATLGGMINTDASGQGSCVYGKTRDHVLGLRSVLLGGDLIDSGPVDDAILKHEKHSAKVSRVYETVDQVFKGNETEIRATFPPLNRCLTGYDLAHIRDEDGKFNLNNILCGSEGTLAFISEAKLNVLKIPKYATLAVVKYTDFDASLRDAKALMALNPTSIETIDSKVLQLAMNDFSWHHVAEFFPEEDRPVRGINLVEFTAHSAAELQTQVQNFCTSLNRTDEAANPLEGSRISYHLAEGAESVKKIWAMRKRAVGLLGNMQGEARPVPFVEDTAVPPEHLADFIAEFRAILDRHQLHYGMFGHVDAGVLHVRPALDMKNLEHEKLAWNISDEVAALTQKYGGLLWGEHGKGLRSGYAPEFFGALYPQLQKIKSAFDPRNQMNPGKIATPSDEHQLLNVSEVPTRGQHDRIIPTHQWQEFSDAVYCNGNGACFNWNAQDAMCPSWKASRDRRQSPKGRASLLREWLRLQGENTIPVPSETLSDAVKKFPDKWRNTRAKARGEADFSHEVYDAMATCLACKSCAGQCPIKVNVPEFRSQFLAHYHGRYLRPLKDYLVAGLEDMLPLAARAPWLYNALMGFKPVQSILAKMVGFVDGPRLSRDSLKGLRFADAQTLAELDDSARANVVVLVQDAFTSYFETDVVLDTYRLLQLLGFTPLIAPFFANGKPLHVHGFLGRFKHVAQKTSRALNAISARGLPLVGIDPSMTLVYRSEYAKALPNEPQPQVMLFQEWLAKQLESRSPPKLADREGSPVTLLPHCTEATNAAESLGQWQRVFSTFGLTLQIEAVGCCGMSGTFGHEAKNKPMSQQLFNMSWREPLERLNPDHVVATGFSCRSQIKREAERRVPHPAQWLLKAIIELKT